RFSRDWSSDVCSSDLVEQHGSERATRQWSGLLQDSSQRLLELKLDRRRIEFVDLQAMPFLHRGMIGFSGGDVSEPEDRPLARRKIGRASCRARREASA